MIDKNKEYENIFYEVLDLVYVGYRIDESYIMNRYNKDLKYAKEMLKDIDIYIEGIDTNILLETIWSWGKEYVNKEYISLRLEVPLFLADILYDLYLNTEEYNISFQVKEGDLLLDVQ